MSSYTPKKKEFWEISSFCYTFLPRWDGETDQADDCEQYCHLCSDIIVNHEKYNHLLDYHKVASEFNIPISRGGEKEEEKK